ncbi:hypothetical protein PoB_006184200 [Plakobranchus ocellatus]|uniref:Uncharacterized protein n=1 Tax=Plakobranchus ocellatus TaxID=259542 RepID=A0AAV4CTV5_9GAST|nr:hypothetical protein PoB_006184200 [Plakobranchus ocellatus]
MNLICARIAELGKTGIDILCSVIDATSLVPIQLGKSAIASLFFFRILKLIYMIVGVPASAQAKYERLPKQRSETSIQIQHSPKHINTFKDPEDTMMVEGNEIRKVKDTFQKVKHYSPSREYHLLTHAH